ncbi:MAG TPA: response regulator [Anaerolineales bacterium]|nr:response regulator [Anaerolineales bacterium]
MNIPQGPLLVVEDVPNIRDLLQYTLKFKGYPVITARNGEDALAKIAEERPALIISDVLMPIMDGFDLCQRIRNNPETRDIPIILISATYVAPEDRSFAIRLGAVRFLEKPVDTDEFLLTVAEILTQGLPNIPAPISDKEFYREYRTRLETKLQQKAKQITRTLRLLETLPEEQKPPFHRILEEETAHRDSIQRELDQIRRFLVEDQANPS